MLLVARIRSVGDSFRQISLLNGNACTFLSGNENKVLSNVGVFVACVLRLISIAPSGDTKFTLAVLPMTPVKSCYHRNLPLTVSEGRNKL